MAAAAFLLPWGKFGKSPEKPQSNVAEAAPADIPQVAAQAKEKAPPAVLGNEKPAEQPKKEGEPRVVDAQPKIEAPPEAVPAPKVVKLPKEGLTLKDHTGRVGQLAFSRDGARLVSGSFDGTVKVWDIESGKVLTSFAKHKNLISAVEFSPDGNTVASAGGDNTIRLFDAMTGEETTEFDPAQRTTRVLFLPDGKTLLSSSADQTVKRWEIGQKMPVASYDNGFGVRDMAIAPDGSTFASTGAGKVIIRSTANGKTLIELPAETGAISLAYSPDGKALAGTVLGG